MVIGKEEYYENDELKIYRGEDFIVQKHIILHQPTLGEICDFSEKEYYSMLYNFTATPQSLKVQLWEGGIDYTEIQPFQLFYTLLYKAFPIKKTSIIFGDLDFSKFQVRQKEDDDSIFLYQAIPTGNIYELIGSNIKGKKLHHFSSLTDAAKFVNTDEDTLIDQLSEDNRFGNYIFDDVSLEPVIIDEFTYNMIIDYLCKTHFIERDFRIPANNSTKMVLIEDAKEEMERAKNKEYHSQLKNMISAMINSEGFKYNHEQVWNMKINAFMDSVKRIGKIKNAQLLLQSGYSGFGISFDDIDKKQIDWLGELD